MFSSTYRVMLIECIMRGLWASIEPDLAKVSGGWWIGFGGAVSGLRFCRASVCVGENDDGK